MRHPVAIVVGLFACALCACGEDEWKCAPPAGAIAADGDFEINFVGETASFRSDTMQVAIESADDETIEVWACQERGDEMWIAEVLVSRGTLPSVPASFGANARSPRFRAWLTRYDKYQLLEDELGEGSGALMGGILSTFDAEPGRISMFGELSEPCSVAQCQADDRSIDVIADLRWP